MESPSLLLNVIRVWAAGAWADGHIAPKERTVLEKFIGLANLPEHERKEALGYLHRPVKVDEADIELLSSAERQSLYGAACRLTTVDGHVAEEERAFLRRLRASLELDEGMAATIERSAGVSQV